MLERHGSERVSATGNKVEQGRPAIGIPRAGSQLARQTLKEASEGSEPKLGPFVEEVLDRLPTRTAGSKTLTRKAAPKGRLTTQPLVKPNEAPAASRHAIEETGSAGLPQPAVASTVVGQASGQAKPRQSIPLVDLPHLGPHDEPFGLMKELVVPAIPAGGMLAEKPLGSGAKQQLETQKYGISSEPQPAAQTQPIVGGESAALAAPDMSVGPFPGASVSSWPPTVSATGPLPRAGITREQSVVKKAYVGSFKATSVKPEVAMPQATVPSTAQEIKVGFVLLPFCKGQLKQKLHSVGYLLVHCGRQQAVQLQAVWRGHETRIWVQAAAIVRCMRWDNASGLASGAPERSNAEKPAARELLGIASREGGQSNSTSTNTPTPVKLQAKPQVCTQAVHCRKATPTPVTQAQQAGTADPPYTDSCVRSERPT